VLYFYTKNEGVTYDVPEIVLPKIVLPFDVPVLLHPIAVHFLIVLPIVVLLLELTNLLMKKKAVGGVSFFLILLIMVAAVAAYMTGLTDGKEAYETLSEAAKSDLAEHKLLGTYILLGSAIIFVFKLLAMSGNKILKGLYIVILIGFVATLFEQGEEGGELVYEHGVNVEKVKTLNSQISDLKDTLENMKEEAKKVVPVPVSTPATKVPVSPLENTGVETISSSTQKTTSQNTIEPTKDVQVIPPESKDIPAQ
jgi:uncharacterized membrane protein